MDYLNKDLLLTIFGLLDKQSRWKARLVNKWWLYWATPVAIRIKHSSMWPYSISNWSRLAEVVTEIEYLCMDTDVWAPIITQFGQLKTLIINCKRDEQDLNSGNFIYSSRTGTINGRYIMNSRKPNAHYNTSYIDIFVDKIGRFFDDNKKICKQIETIETNWYIDANIIDQYFSSVAYRITNYDFYGHWANNTFYFATLFETGKVHTIISPMMPYNRSFNVQYQPFGQLYGELANKYKIKVIDA
jgi:hypothetical protein